MKWINALTFQLFRPNFKSSLVNEEFCHSLDLSGHFVFIMDYHSICQSGSSCIGKHKNASSVEHHACIVESNRLYPDLFVVQMYDLNIMHSCFAVFCNILFLLGVNTALI